MKQHQYTDSNQKNGADHISDIGLKVVYLSPQYNMNEIENYIEGKETDRSIERTLK